MIWDWLVFPVDSQRAHDVGMALSWHARSMVLAWAVLAPLAILIARFFKVLPWQDWPREVNNHVWWRTHWMAQSAAVALSGFGLGLILVSDQNTGTALFHRFAGYSVLALAVLQVASGLLRGSKGGPTEPRPDGSTPGDSTPGDSIRGDHYDMTPRRLVFETVHKAGGYLALAIATVAIASGMWRANAPGWMWLTILMWWAALAVVAIRLQSAGRAIDTYQAIWGPDQVHPGNRIRKRGWGTVRIEQDRRRT